MTREKLPRAVAVRMVATKALEGYAAKALDADVVLAAVTKAAADGFYACRVQFDRAVNLQETDAAKALEALLRREGFELEWPLRLVIGRENASGADVWAADLLLRW